MLVEKPSVVMPQSHDMTMKGPVIQFLGQERLGTRKLVAGETKLVKGLTCVWDLSGHGFCSCGPYTFPEFSTGTDDDAQKWFFRGVWRRCLHTCLRVYVCA